MKLGRNISGRRTAKVLAAILIMMLISTSVPVYAAGGSGTDSGQNEEQDVSAYAEKIADADIPESAKEAYSNGDPEFFRYYTIDDSGDIVKKSGQDGQVSTQSLSRSTASSSYKHPSKYKNYTIYDCVDVSAWQGEINWKKVKAAGITHAIIRVGFRLYGSKGTLMKDSWFDKNMENANKAGIKLGVYIYSQALNKKEAEEEAAYTIKYIKKYKDTITMPVVFDYEFSPSGGRFTAGKISKKTMTNNCIYFCEKIKAAGFEPMVYANYSMLSNHLDSSRLESKYKIWLAHYNKTTSYAGEFYIWQYTSEGSVKGITGDVDMNFIYHSAVKDVKDYTAYTSTALNYRDEPVSGSVIGTLDEGTKITITAESAGWGRLGGTYEGKDYWVSLDYVRKPSDIKSYAKNGDGKYVFVRYDGKTAVSQWVTYSGKTYYVGSTGAKLTGYKKVGSYYYLFGTDGARKTGTVTVGNKQYKLLSSGKAVLYTAKTKDMINYRTGPSTSYTSKGTYKKGKTLSIIREKNGWGYNSSGYWVSLKYVKKVTKYPVTKFASYKVKTTTDVNYRKGPGTSYKKAGAYPKGRTVTITAVKNGWGRMSNGYWIKLSYTKKL